MLIFRLNVHECSESEILSLLNTSSEQVLWPPLGPSPGPGMMWWEPRQLCYGGSWVPCRGGMRTMILFHIQRGREQLCPISPEGVSSWIQSFGVQTHKTSQELVSSMGSLISPHLGKAASWHAMVTEQSCPEVFPGLYLDALGGTGSWQAHLSLAPDLIVIGNKKGGSFFVVVIVFLFNLQGFWIVL